MAPQPLTNFEIQKYYQNKSRFHGVYSRDNLPKVKVGAYVINLDEYSDIGTHRIALYVLNNNVTYFDSFLVEHIPNEIRTFISNKNIQQIFLEYKHMIRCADIFVLDLLILCWVLLNCAPTSTQLHPPPPSSFQPPPIFLQYPQQYLNQNIARTWAISPNLGRKLKSCPF